jgi:hypothetical protein
MALIDTINEGINALKQWDIGGSGTGGMVVNEMTDAAYNLAEKKYLDQVREIRAALLGDKLYETGGGVNDKSTLLYFLRLQSYALLLKTFSDYTYTHRIKRNFDVDVKKEDNFLPENPQYRELESSQAPFKERQKIFSDTMLAKQVKDTVPFAESKSADEIRTEAAKSSKEFWEVNHGSDGPTSDMISSGFESNANTFPKPNQEVSTHNTNNGRSYVNKDSYKMNSKGNIITVSRGWTKPDGTPDPNTYGTPDKPMSEKLNEMIRNYNRTVPGSYKFFIEKLHGKGIDGIFYKKGPIKPGLTRVDLPNRMVFPAYIEAFNDAYDAEWNPYSFYGRSEEVWVYKKTARSLTLSFYMISDFSAELLTIGMKNAKTLSANLNVGGGGGTDKLAPFKKLLPESYSEQANSLNLIKNKGINSMNSFNKDLANINSQVNSALGYANQNLNLNLKNPTSINNGVRAANGLVNNVNNLNLTASSVDMINKMNDLRLSDADKLAELKKMLPDWGTGSTALPYILNGELSGFVGGQLSGTPEMLWTRLTFLAQCCYPWYRRDGKLKEQPFIRVRIGDFIDCVAKINNLSLDEYDQLDMDLNPSAIGAIPMGVKVTLNMTIVHENEPSSQYTRFYHRQDFDNEDINFVPDSMSVTNISCDSFVDNSAGQSDLSEKPGSMSTMQKKLQEDLSQYSKTLKTLQNSLGNLNDLNKKLKIKEALNYSKRFTKVEDLFNAQQLKESPTMVGNNIAELRKMYPPKA